MSATARIIDANANRAREALRVMEDVARFALDDAAISAELKGLRHGLRETLDRLPPGWLVASRDTGHDVGTTIGTAPEMRRRGIVDLVVAAGKRAAEALRVMEETVKIVDPEIAGSLESLRYRSYEIDARLQRRLGSGRAQQWRLCVVLTERLCAAPWLEVARAAIAGGADCLQLREKELDGGELLARTTALVEIARPAGAAVIVNDRADVALAAGADGVHLGRDDLPIPAARALAGRSLLIGATVHDLEEAEHAVASGADSCGVGTVFASTVKPGRPPAGPGLVAAFVERFPRTPHLAIGGITPGNIAELVACGARGVAVSTCVCAADDPRDVVARLREAVDAAETVEAG